MKKILNALFLALLAVITFSACSDVPSPYDIKGEGDVPELTGDGSKELPYTVADLKVKADGKTVAWVEAYIVAGIKSSAEMSIKSADDVVFGTQPTDVKATSFLIADSGEESDYKNCSAVNLNGQSTGCSAVKAALNLVDNNTVSLPRVVKLKGTLVTNTWGLPGLKEVTAAILADGTVIGEEGEGNPSDQDNPFGLDDSNPLNEIKADFEEQPDFVQEGTYNSNLNYDYTLEGWKNIAYVSDRKWTGVVYKDNAKYIQASANKGTAATYTSWFVSPAFTVDNIKDKVISFDCAGAYFYATTTLKVYFLELQNGVMQKTEVPVTGIPTSGTNFEWVKGIQINLSDHAGKVGFIGFEYVAEGGASKSTTYQLDNIKSGKDGSDPTPEPGEDNPLGLDATNPVADFENTFDDAVHQTDYSKVGWINKALKESRVWQGSKYNDQLYLAASTYGVSEGQTAEYWFVTPAFTVNNDKEFTFDCSVNKYAATMSLKVFFLQLENGKMTQKDLNITVPTSGTYEWTTGIKVDLSDFNNKVGFVGFQYVATKEGTTVSTYAIDNVKYTTGEGGDVDPTPDPAGGDLFISEYVEGSSNNKYLEIYNPTGASVDLSSYSLKLEQDGKGAWTKTLKLTGMLASKTVIVYANTSAVKYTGTVIKDGNVITFNGNDPIGLFKNDNLIDYFGKSSKTPGTAADDFAKDQTFRRKSTVKAPSKEYNANEWEVLTKDDVSGLGSHTME